MQQDLLRVNLTFLLFIYILNNQYFINILSTINIALKIRTELSLYIIELNPKNIYHHIRTSNLAANGLLMWFRQAGFLLFLIFK